MNNAADDNAPDHLAPEDAPEDAQERGQLANDDDINVLALVKGTERYVFLYEDSQRAQALRTLGRFASNPELSFSWYDAAVLSQKLRNAAPVGEIKVRGR